MMNDKKLPQKTIERLSSYRRALVGLSGDRLTHVYSHQLAQIVGATAVQVRRDLMLIGFSSSARMGYDIKKLARYISAIIDAKKMPRAAFVGMGNLAQAINHYFSVRKTNNMEITAAFDSDAQKIGKTLFGVKCYGVEDFATVVEEQEVEIIILSCPSDVALGLQQSIENSRVRGVLNFTSASLQFTRDVYVENYDISTLFEKVIYFSK